MAAHLHIVFQFIYLFIRSLVLTFNSMTMCKLQQKEQIKCFFLLAYSTDEVIANFIKTKGMNRKSLNSSTGNIHTINFSLVVRLFSSAII